MKPNPFISSVGLFLLLSASASAQQTDKDQIKAVIEKEARAYFGVDRQAWEVTWLDAPYAFWSYYDSTGGSFVEGTPKIRRNFEEYFSTAKPSVSKIDRVWQEFRIYGNGAYVRFVQKITDEIDHDETSEVRMLEKDKDGKWKIVCLFAMARYPDN
jgi:ketosteroid isomerase-like protein